MSVGGHKQARFALVGYWKVAERQCQRHWNIGNGEPSNTGYNLVFGFDFGAVEVDSEVRILFVFTSGKHSLGNIYCAVVYFFDFFSMEIAFLFLCEHVVNKSFAGIEVVFQFFALIFFASVFENGKQNFVARGIGYGRGPQNVGVKVYAYKTRGQIDLFLFYVGVVVQIDFGGVQIETYGVARGIGYPVFDSAFGGFRF